MKLKTHDVPGHETIYVECDCGIEKRKTLFENLKSSASDAIKIQLHDDQQGNDRLCACSEGALLTHICLNQFITVLIDALMKIHFVLTSHFKKARRVSL